MLKKYAYLTLVSLAILLLIGLTPSIALASNPLGITLTPTEEVTSTPEPATATPLSPTPTETPIIQPPNSSPTPTSQLATPPAPTETPEPEEPEPTRPAPVLPETGEGPVNPPLNWTGLSTALVFALIGTLVFRVLSRSRKPE